ncbi:ABC transporter ATP-binding protein [Rhodovulum sulfidophilum]|uniref:ABC transporter ATP-binding protein n=1 Tax=Rhodovulum sulfidophilum TaxID=35806 RepID=A0ABS1RWW1_RHOSU|nr:ABC transporter ATP-binding protein [Rhodovulum sulfidophilum]MBL3610578.1 ABC transporter ATP-binding protein [Rhodovulum sulfidophilum]MCE8456625.1 ABC transporter ATP-binding protein/permease [Rhodovulum sulfidophilum]
MIWPFLFKNKALLLSAIVAGIIKFTTPLLVIGLTASVVDTVTARDAPGVEITGELLLSIFKVIAVVTIFWLPSAYLRQYLCDTLSVRAAVELRAQMFANLLNQPYQKRMQFRAGDIGTRLLGDVQQIAGLIGDGLVYFWIDLCSVMIACVFILAEDLWVGGLAIAILPVYYLALGHYRQKIRQHSTKVQNDLGAVSAHVQERVQAIQVIQDLGAVDFERTQLQPRLEKARQSFLARSRTKSFSVMVSSFLTQVPSFVVLGVGGYAVLSGQLSVGSFTAIALYVRQIFWPLDNLSNFNVKLAMAQGSMDRLSEIWDTQDHTIRTREPIRRKALTVESLEFQLVSGGYGDPVLRHVSFKANRGDWIAVVGKSGTGKTTLTRLLMRWIPPMTGRILINGQDINTISLDTWRARVGYVSQDNLLFSGTLIENIAYTDHAPNYDRAWQACRDARISDFIEDLPNKLDHELKEFGTTLSAGQLQRLCLARALYRAPDVLILDEVTANLDSETEVSIYEMVRAAARDKIVLTVAHRPAVLSFATHRLLLDNQESHFSLMTPDPPPNGSLHVRAEHNT